MKEMTMIGSVLKAWLAASAVFVRQAYATPWER